MDSPFFPEVLKKQRKFISNQNHSKYTSYPAEAQVRVLGNINDTFNKDINSIRENFDRKRSKNDVTSLQEEINCINEWGKTWGLNFNEKKCTYNFYLQRERN